MSNYYLWRDTLQEDFQDGGTLVVITLLEKLVQFACILRRDRIEVRLQDLIFTRA